MSLPRKQEKTDTSFWDSQRGKIYTEKGGMVIGEAIYCHGYSMMDELLGRTSFFQVLVLNVTGRLPERRLADCLEAIFLCVSYPDARIWCNQIGSLAGTLRASPVAGVSAGILASDSRLYGPGTLLNGVHFIRDALAKKQGGWTVEDIVENVSQAKEKKGAMLPGYNRPVLSGDERIEALERITNNLGFHRGEHLTLAYELSDLMQKKYNEEINAMGFCVAFLCDQGFTAIEQYRLLSVMVHSGVNACHAEASDNPPESFFPLHCNDIDYQGPALRPVPDKK